MSEITGAPLITEAIVGHRHQLIEIVAHMITEIVAHRCQTEIIEVLTITGMVVVLRNRIGMAGVLLIIGAIADPCLVIGTVEVHLIIEATVAL